MATTHHVVPVCNWFIARADREGELLTILKLQAFVYIANGWHLHEFKIPLIDSIIQAPEIGPHIPEILDEYSIWGGTGRVHVSGPEMPDDPESISLMENVWNAYKPKTTLELAGIVMGPSSAWKTALLSGSATIEPSHLLEYYETYERMRSQLSVGA